MGLAQRMSRLRKLLEVRIGPGAAILPRNVQRIQLDIANKALDGHLGGRRVWREYLPRLKYHNPTVAMVVNRSPDLDGPSVMKLTFDGGRQETIEMKHRKDTEILEQFITVTKATPVTATLEEEAQLQRIADQQIKSEEQRKLSRMKYQEEKQEAAMLAQAKAAIASARAE